MTVWFLLVAVATNRGGVVPMPMVNEETGQAGVPEKRKLLPFYALYVSIDRILSSR